MNKLFLAFCLTIISSAFAFAQSSDYKKAEGYVGYSNQQVDSGFNADSGNGTSTSNFFNDRLRFNGFEASGVYNVRRYVGLKADFSAAYRNQDFSFATGTGTTANTINVRTSNQLYNFLGGVQFKDNSSDARVKPFAHALVGAGHGRTKFKNVTCTNTTAATCTSFVANTASTDSETGLAGAFGGGLDIKLSDRIDLRAIQVDYNPIRFNGGTDNNFRFGIGIVFK